MVASTSCGGGAISGGGGVVVMKMTDRYDAVFGMWMASVRLSWDARGQGCEGLRGLMVMVNVSRRRMMKWMKLHMGMTMAITTLRAWDRVRSCRRRRWLGMMRSIRTRWRRIRKSRGSMCTPCLSSLRDATVGTTGPIMAPYNNISTRMAPTTTATLRGIGIALKGFMMARVM